MIAFGSVNGWKVINKFGHNSDVGSTIEDVWAAGGVYSYLTAATLMEVVSSSTNDAAAGTGCRSVVIEGLDANFEEQTETVATNGTAAVATVKEYLRINRMYSSSTGTYGIGTAGNITLRVASAGATQAFIEFTSDSQSWDFGQTQLARYTVPAGKKAFVTSMNLGIESGKGADIVVSQRQNAGTVSAPFSPRRLLKSIDGLNGAVSFEFDGPLVFAPKTDIIIKTRLTSGANGRVHVSYDIFVGDI